MIQEDYTVELLLAEAKDDIEKASLLHEYALKVSRKSPFFMLSLSLQALNFAQLARDYTVIADSYRICGVAYSYLSEFAKALQQFKNALVYYQKANSNKGRASVIRNLGALYQEMGQYEIALEYLLESLEICQQIGDLDGLASNLVNTARIYYILHDNGKALEYYNQVLEYAEKNDNKDYYSIALGNIGLIHARDGNYEEAIECHLQSLRLKREIGNLLGEASELANLGIVYAQQNDFENALYYFNESIRIRKDLYNERGIAMNLVNISEVYRKAGDSESALHYILQAIDTAQRIDSQEILSHAHQEAAKIFEQTGDFAQAYRHHVKYASYKDGVINDDRIKSLAALQVQYDTERSLKQQEELRRKLLEVEQMALQSQMNPHFVSNALYAIQGLITDGEKEPANRYLSRFAKLIRLTLEQVRKRFISLAEEVQTISLYLELESLRFQKKFDYTIVVEEGLNTQELKIPPMLLQPYIENAIKHGILPTGRSGCLLIKICKYHHGYLQCIIEDNGIGRNESIRRKKLNNPHTSLGMNITKERLSLLQQSLNKEFEVDIIDLFDEDGTTSLGTRIVITLPQLNEALLAEAFL
jgi:tetratricopeptide (TPR) repeat protein